ncbi:VOC family protein [Iodobacter arcticus]|uniref:VOC family protein n=1 Tax=Iodobacter arcticus TaxID=590593 RepID=A0ABW2R2L0_9NEIS
MNLNQITLAALNINESIRFYQKMGFTLIVESGHYARFECPQGEATFSIHQAEHAAADSGVVIYFEHQDLDSKVCQLQKLGLVFFQEPRDEPWLWREARLHDPSGNTICLYWAGGNRKNPPWRINV